jgi:hypothetical protein
MTKLWSNLTSFELVTSIVITGGTIIQSMEEQTINKKYERKSSLKDKFISRVKQLSPIAMSSKNGSRSQSIESELSVNGGSDAFKEHSTQSSIITSFSQVSSAIWGFLGLDSSKLSPSTDTATPGIQVPDIKDDNNNHSISQEFKRNDIGEQCKRFPQDISTTHIEFLGTTSSQYGRNIPAGVDPIHYIDSRIQQNPILLTSDIASAVICNLSLNDLTHSYDRISEQFNE